jgi:hypothetical protein
MIRDIATASGRMRAVLLILAACAAGIGYGVADGQALRSEKNLRDAIQGRQTFTPEQRDALDVNKDGKLDVADIVAYLQESTVPVVLFNESFSTVEEGAGQVQIPLTLTKDFSGVVNFSVKGTAVEGIHFTIPGGHSLNVNGDSGFISVNILDDLVSEDIKFIQLELSTGQGYLPGLNSVHHITIRDNDGVWQGAIEADGAVFSLSIELLQQAGAIAGGHILSPGTVIYEGTPDEQVISGTTFPVDPDGIELDFTGTDAQRFKVVTNDIEIELPLGPNTFTFLRRFEFEADPARIPDPGEEPDVYDPSLVIRGRVRDVTEPPPGTKSLSHLARTREGHFAFVRVQRVTTPPDVNLVDSK